MKALRQLGKIVAIASLCVESVFVYAQGTREDYARAERFLPGNVRRLVSEADVAPHWIEKSERFWYRKESSIGKEFLLVDAAQNTRVPAFDHRKLAVALSQAAGKEFRSNKLPFDRIEFVQQGAAIRFEAEGARWTCTLGELKCSKDAEPNGRQWEGASPDGKWAAYVDHYNLYVRNVSAGEVIPLTHDGEKSWDYATPLPSSRLLVEQGTEDVRQRPAVFWSPDSLTGYRASPRLAAYLLRH